MTSFFFSSKKRLNKDKNSMRLCACCLVASLCLVSRSLVCCVSGSQDRDLEFVQACAVEMHTWTCSKSALMREFTRKMRPARWIARPRPTLCASMRNRNAHGHVTRAILRENYRGGAAPDGSRDRRPRFERAWAVEMHMDMSQEPSYARTYNQNAACQMDPETAAHTSRERAQSKCTWTCHKSHLMRELPGKCRARWIHPRFVRACAIEMHMDMSQQPFCARIMR